MFMADTGEYLSVITSSIIPADDPVVPGSIQFHSDIEVYMPRAMTAPASIRCICMPGDRSEPRYHRARWYLGKTRMRLSTSGRGRLNSGAVALKLFACT